MTTELSAKKELLRSLLKCPHRDLKQTIPIFSDALNKDPFFAGKCFYALTMPEYNQLRDLEESGIAFLLTSPHSLHREAGRICLQTLEPYRVYRVGNFIRQSLKSNRQVKGAITDYLHTLESDRKRFDGAARVAGRDLHRLFEHYHIRPSQRTQIILFDHEIPEGEVDPVLILRKAKTPEEQAKIIVDYRIPYRQATSVLKGLTPAVWVALIEVMTPVEAMNLRSAIEKSGILKDSDIRSLYEKKLSLVAREERAAVSTITERKSTKGKDKKLDAILAKAREEKIEKGARITVDTLIAVDCSGSMDPAIEASRRICPHIASLCDARLEVYCFNDTAWKLECSSGTFEDFQKAFQLIRANGQTSLGSALRRAVQDGFVPEQVVFITDQEENSPPHLERVFRDVGQDIRFVFVNLGHYSSQVASELERDGAEITEFDFRAVPDTPGWYSSMDNFVPLLTQGGYAQLVEQIMALELPSRKT